MTNDQWLTGFWDYKAKTDIIDTLTVASEDRKAVMLTYQSQHATEPATRDVYPYGLARHKGSIYLAALAFEHESIRLYKVDRIDAAEITEFGVQRPADFTMSAYLARVRTPYRLA
jgi:predicted DNA-binding transcriptional regulator YafY